MRDLTTVIEQLKAVIPQPYDQNGNARELIVALDRVLYNIFFTAPEIMMDRWMETQSILEELIPVPYLDWHHEMGKIWSNK